MAVRAFNRRRDNLVAGDTNKAQDVFVAIFNLVLIFLITSRPNGRPRQLCVLLTDDRQRRADRFSERCEQSGFRDTCWQRETFLRDVFSARTYAFL